MGRGRAAAGANVPAFPLVQETGMLALPTAPTLHRQGVWLPPASTGWLPSAVDMCLLPPSYLCLSLDSERRSVAACADTGTCLLAHLPTHIVRAWRPTSLRTLHGRVTPPWQPGWAAPACRCYRILPPLASSHIAAAGYCGYACTPRLRYLFPTTRHVPPNVALAGPPGWTDVRGFASWTLGDSVTGDVLIQDMATSSAKLSR